MSWPALILCALLLIGAGVRWIIRKINGLEIGGIETW